MLPVAKPSKLTNYKSTTFKHCSLTTQHFDKKNKKIILRFARNKKFTHNKQRGSELASGGGVGRTTNSRDRQLAIHSRPPRDGAGTSQLPPVAWPGRAQSQKREELAEHFLLPPRCCCWYAYLAFFLYFLSFLRLFFFAAFVRSRTPRRPKTSVRAFKFYAMLCRRNNFNG